jgi:5S rRNA maturation endonuclease (ribonuclease M5)
MRVSPHTARALTSARDDLEPLADLVARVDLPALVERYAGPGKHTAGRWTFRCPNPSHDDRHPSFTVARARSGRWYGRCWSQCSAVGAVDALALVQWLDGLDVPEAAAKLRTITGTPDPFTSKRTNAPTPPPAVHACTTTAEAPYTPPVDNDPRMPDAAGAELLRLYCQSRGWPVEVIDRHGLEAVTVRGWPAVRHPYRVPDTDGGLSVMWWQDRPRTAPGRPKWLAPSGHRPVPFGLEHLDGDDLRTVIVCEGPADAITAGVAAEPFGTTVAAIGIPGAQSWTAGWAEFVAGLHVIVCTDPDPAGDALAARIVADLEVAGCRVHRYRPGAGDLTDTAKRTGVEAVRHDLTELITADAAQLLGEAFPGTQLLEAGTVEVAA